MFSKAIHYFWPDLDDYEIKKYTMLSTIFFLLIGSSWLMRSLKNIIFLKITFPESMGYALNYGLLMQPIAKFWTPLITIPLILMYSKLIDWYKKETVYFIIIIFYTFIFTAISIILAIHHFKGEAFIGKHFLSSIGWIIFFSVETFYSIIIALFWSFTNSICTTQSAQKGYPSIIAIAQFACIAASVPLLNITYFGGTWVLFSCATAMSCSTIFFMRYFLRTTSAHQLIGNVNAHQTETQHDSFFQGFTSGISLICKHSYILCILIITCSYEIIAQIIEYQTLSMAATHIHFIDSHGFATFQGIFGIAIHCISLLITLYGTQYVIKRYSLRRCLLIMPIALLIILTTYLIFYLSSSQTQEHTLWISLSIMTLMNGLGFAFNNPAKEILYIPTSKIVKFKSKGWIDIFGIRTAKQSGAQINHLFKHDLSQLIILGSLCGIGLTLIWTVAAWYIGNQNKHLITTKNIIE